MKKTILILFTIIIPAFAFANDSDTQSDIQNNDINLELTQPKKTINLTKPDYKAKQDYNISVQKNKNHDISVQTSNDKQTVNVHKNKKYKNATVGTQSTYSTTPDTYSSSGTVYSEYEHKKSKINTSYTKNTTPNQQNQDKGTLSVTPEYEINKHLSVQNKFSTDLNNNSQKNEVKVKLKPFKDDRMDIGAGAGQKYSETGTSTQVNFTTNFKW